MKISNKTMRILFLSMILTCFSFIVKAQYFQATVKVELTASGPEAVFFITPNATGSDISDGLTSVEFFITYPPAYSLTFGAVTVNTTNFPGLSMTDGGENAMGVATSGNNTQWYYYSGIPTTTKTYTAGVEYEVFRVPITSSLVDFGDLKLEYDGTAYSTYLVLTGSIGTGYTVVDQNLDVPVYYGSGIYSGGNGDAVLGGSACQYTIADQPLVSMVLFDNSVWHGGLGIGNSPGNGDGAKKCYIKDAGAQVTDADANIFNLVIESGADLSIPPNIALTALGSTHISDAEGFSIQSDATGTGSFIDNGTITYGGSGSAKVQTYLANSAGVGNFDIHLVGPTLDQENYTGAGTGAFLEEFILDGAPTYAYEWDESVPNTADAWVNLNSLTDEIYSAMGIGLSTIDNTNHTLEMTGQLITGNVSSPTLAFTNNHYELISNPYPSSIDFDALYDVNDGVVNDKFYLWNPAANSWVEYAGGAGGDQFIQVGQGFFVETHAGAGGTFNFTNDERTHSNIAFRETMANILNVKVEGGMEGYQDDIVIRFDEEATSGYDINLEAEFWESQNDDATSLRSLTADNLQLAINVLPLEILNNGDMLSIPLVFTCGYNTEYAFTFSDLESFDLGTEIWLEDKLTGGDWISLNNQPEYTFFGSPDEASDRFMLHFFGPTGTEEMDQPTIDLYASGPYAYVRNNTEETIQEIRIYSLSGALMNQVHTPDQKFLKLWVDDQMAYYVITVITDQQVYTKKLFISK